MQFIIVADSTLKVDIGYVKKGTHLEVRKIASWKDNLDFVMSCEYYLNNNMENPPRQMDVHISEMDVNNPGHINRLLTKFHTKEKRAH